MLENIHSPEDIKGLSYDELYELSDEIRETIISTVSKNGGHLASNLGIVELTLALHRVFNTPSDSIIFDVSHQSYTHKIITDRFYRMNTLRKYGGISGFTDRFESEYDTVTCGHSGSSISTAIGIAEANRLAGNGRYVIAVVGDGSFTNGMIYEAINNCSECRGLRLIIVLNDNEMSITKNVGGMTEYLSRIRTSRGYLRAKYSADRTLAKIPLIGTGIAKFLKWIKDTFKSIFIRDTLFENLGIPYIGPVDGNDSERLEDVLTEVKRRGECALVHIITKKGLGYDHAEAEPEKYHSTGAFDPARGVASSNEPSYTSVFGDIICSIAKNNSKIYAITCAMRDGVGLGGFSKEFPDRYRDVGIAEEHSVAFAGGLALAGMNPVCAVYSTFLQRTFDQVYHDVALQRAHVTLAVDHCGIVPGDGYTHQGIYDVSLFASIPNVTIYSPETYDELESSLIKATVAGDVNIVRYPKGSMPEYQRSRFCDEDGFTYCIPDSPDAVIVTYGIITEEAVRAAKLLSVKYNIGIIKLVKIFPLDLSELIPLMRGAKLVYVLEEGVKHGGIGEYIASSFAVVGKHTPVFIRAIDGEFIPHGDRGSLLSHLSLDASSVADELGELLR